MRLVGGAGCRLQLQVAGSMGGQDRGRGWHRRWAGIQGWASRTGLASGGGHPGAGIQGRASRTGLVSRGGHPGVDIQGWAVIQGAGQNQGSAGTEISQNAKRTGLLWLV